ncbi:MAG: L,D-transpeptidase family protein [Verrucomicrobiota bacterium]
MRILTPLLAVSLFLGVEGLPTPAEAQSTNASSKSIRMGSGTKARGPASQRQAQKRRSGPRTDYTWSGAPGTRVTRIRIDIGSQRIYAYSASGDLVGKSPVSTGKAGHETPTGSFRVMNKSANHRSNLYGQIIGSGGRVIDSDASSYQSKPAGSYFVGSPMPYFMRMTSGGVGMHAGYVTGRPASHGCIRLPNSFAAKLFAATRTGTPVEVVY